MTPVTVVQYMYRDASNYKQIHEEKLSGAITDEQRAVVQQSLYAGETFIPEQIGWPHAGRDSEWNFPTHDDHCWHELDTATDISVVELGGPAPEQTVEDWVAKMTAAHAAGWDDITYAIGD